MLIQLLLVFVSFGLGFGAAFFFWRQRPIRFELETPALPKAYRRFRVVMSTESGAEARKLYERLTPKGDGLVEFYEDAARRSLKEA